MKHLNWYYGLALLIGLVISTIGVIGDGSAVAWLVYITVAVVGGLLVLWCKQRLSVLWEKQIMGLSWVFILLVLSSGLGFPIAVLCFKNVRGIQDADR